MLTYLYNATLLKKVRTVLFNSDSSVSEIAYDLGFEYPQYFSKLFNLAGINILHQNVISNNMINLR